MLVQEEYFIFHKEQKNNLYILSTTFFVIMEQIKGELCMPMNQILYTLNQTNFSKIMLTKVPFLPLIRTTLNLNITFIMIDLLKTMQKLGRFHF